MHSKDGSCRGGIALPRSPRLRALMDFLEVAGSGLTAPDVARAVGAARIGRSDVDPYVRFDRAAYHRQSVAKRPAYEILVLSWLPGQSSPVHNHRGSVCCVSVVGGSAVETRYSVKGDVVCSTQVKIHAEGSLMLSTDTDTHVLAASPGDPRGLITLHVYLPALTGMETFSEVGGRLRPGGPKLPLGPEAGMHVGAP